MKNPNEERRPSDHQLLRKKRAGSWSCVPYPWSYNRQIPAALFKDELSDIGNQPS